MASLERQKGWYRIALRHGGQNHQRRWKLIRRLKRRGSRPAPRTKRPAPHLLRTSTSAILGGCLVRERRSPPSTPRPCKTTSLPAPRRSAAAERASATPPSRRRSARCRVHQGWRVGTQEPGKRWGPPDSCACASSSFALTGWLTRQPSGGRQVEAVEVHHLHPGGDEVAHELFLGVRRAVYLREGPQL